MQYASLNNSSWSNELMIKRSNHAYGIYFMWLMLMSSAGQAAVEKAGLRFNGVDTASFGKKACAATSEEVEVILPNSATQNNNGFKAMIKNITLADKTRADGSCDKTVGDKARLDDIKFTVGKPKIALNKFLSTAQCEENAKPGSRVVCIYDENGDSLLAYAPFDYDASEAKIESITDRSAANGEISFRVKTKGISGPYKVKVCYGPSSLGDIGGSDCPVGFTEKEFKTSEILLTGLENNVEYALKVKLISGKDGEGDWSESFKETPRPVAFVLSGYNGQGGDLQFSCNQSGDDALLFVIVALCAMAVIRLRHRSWSTSHLPQFTHILSVGLMVIAQVFFPDFAHAEVGQVNVGILGGMYRPDLDNETLSSGEKIFPFYKCYFRRKKADSEGPINPLIGGEVDWHIWDKLGSLQLGFGASYTYKEGKALELDANNQPNCDAPIDGAKVSLHMYQIRPQLTYMFNPFAEHFPFVPYIRGALIGHGYMFFKNGKNENAVHTGSTTVKPNGFRFGYQGAVGMMLMLDFLEPGAVRSARGQGLLEHVYLKGELAYTKIDSFGRKGFNFSAKDIMGTNWPLMWTFGLVFELP